MSKPYYETEEYSEAENELDTYDDPVKLVMEYRISEKQKDEQIAGLQHKLEVAKKALELACEELMGDLEFNGELDKHYNLQANIEYFKTKAREMLKSE